MSKLTKKEINEIIAHYEFGDDFLDIVDFKELCLEDLISYRAKDSLGVSHKGAYTESLDSLVPVWKKLKKSPYLGRNSCSFPYFDFYMYQGDKHHGEDVFHAAALATAICILSRSRNE